MFMKKINLSVPEPCHENWNKMTQAEKGKFCGACQKTVIDFTAMSDRQLVEFFKKPLPNVCGRFNNDQLEREIIIPKKRIPWIRYFFQFALPAFLMSLKVQGQTVGQLVPQEQLPKHPVNRETFKENSRICMQSKPEAGVTRQLSSVIVDQDTSKFNFPVYEDAVVAKTPMEEIVVKAYPVMGKLTTTMGSVRTARCSYSAGKKKTSLPDADNKEETSGKFLAYPNPVQAGASVTISFDGKNIPDELLIISSSGQTISSVKENLSKYNMSTAVNIPSQVPAGVYFIRLVKNDVILKTAKFVVFK
jgi:hypothetical protein